MRAWGDLTVTYGSLSSVRKREQREHKGLGGSLFSHFSCFLKMSEVGAIQKSSAKKSGPTARSTRVWIGVSCDVQFSTETTKNNILRNILILPIILLGSRSPLNNYGFH